MKAWLARINKFRGIEFFSRKTLNIGWSFFWRSVLYGIILCWIPIVGIVWAINCQGYITQKLHKQQCSLKALDPNLLIGWAVLWRSWVAGILAYLFWIFLFVAVGESIVRLGLVIGREFWPALSSGGAYLITGLLIILMILATGWAVRRVATLKEWTEP